jgi:hypothetical protein
MEMRFKLAAILSQNDGSRLLLLLMRLLMRLLLRCFYHGMACMMQAQPVHEPALQLLLYIQKNAGHSVCNSHNMACCTGSC